MVQITVEYMILIPVLVLILFLFPFAVSSIMEPWVESRRTLELQGAASHLGSAIQQVYYSLNHTSIQAGTLTSKLDIPLFVDGYWFNGTATIRDTLNPALDPTQVLDIQLRIITLGISTNTSVTLGQNVVWNNSFFLSNATSGVHAPILTAEKLSNGTVRLFFGVVN